MLNKCILAALVLTTTVFSENQIKHHASDEKIVPFYFTSIDNDSSGNLFGINTRNPGFYGKVYLNDTNTVLVDLTQRIVNAGYLVPTSQYHHGRGSIRIDNNNRLYITYPLFKKLSGKPEWGLFLSENGKEWSLIKVKGYPHIETLSSPYSRYDTPLIFCFIATGKRTNEWANHHFLKYFKVNWGASESTLTELGTLSTSALGLSDHSGGSSIACTIGDTTYVVFNQIDNLHSNPVYLQKIYDNKTSDPPLFLFNTHPNKPDVHSTPYLTSDSKGQLHIIGGAHNGSLAYMVYNPVSHTKKTFQIEGKNTYPSIVIDSLDIATLVYRDWYYRAPYIKSPVLKMTRFQNEKNLMSEPVTIASIPDFFGYGVYYHHLRFLKQKKSLLFYTFKTRDNEAQQTFLREIPIK